MAVVLAGCGAAEPAGDALAGERLFNTRLEGIPLEDACSSCHKLTVDTEWAPTLQGISDRAADRVDGMSAAEYLRESIVSPGAYQVEGWGNSMPGQYSTVLTEEDIDNLVAFLLTQ